MSLSTHVLDATTGGPRPGVPVRLETREGELLAEARTDDDGRVSELAARLSTGVYRLTFEVATPFFPEIPVLFRIADPTAHHHVPLLLSPYAYSTYRGS